MVTVELTQGFHSIKMSLNGYSDFTAMIFVDSSGVPSCLTTTTPECNRTTPPGIMINGKIVTFYLKSTGVSVGLCPWITNKGGPSGIVSFDVMLLIKAYLKHENLGFDVKSADIMGAIAYYFERIDSGNQLTGCSF